MKEIAVAAAVVGVVVVLFAWYVTGWVRCSAVGGAYVSTPIWYQCVEIKR